ncbi:MAG TPA: carbohydrate esterase [Erysipelotrichaceae bacterium]|nr:carbohydrate esterase [Erysipelotrichaceae bacterium]HAO60827.1 carbohydrate esterase [Erysipelotrichaceae bacterium]HBZ41913.1 carbohydrate esterase [Erysipelotrichaceae bacterium]
MKRKKKTIGLGYERFLENVIIKGENKEKIMIGTILVIDDFTIPQLDRKRTLRIYLPPGYETSGKPYPVLYMHDAQNIYGGKNGLGGNPWNVHLELEALMRQGFEGMIVVGIDNGGMERFSEYSPWPGKDLESLLDVGRMSSLHFDQLGGRGFRYIDFLCDTLKPYIDERFNTRPDKNDTWIGGSSMGGYISLAAGLSRPDVFGHVLCFSGAFWFNEEAMKSYIVHRGADESMTIYMDIGTNETSNADRPDFPAIYVETNRRVYETLRNVGFDENHLKFLVFEGHTHDEKYWQMRFASALTESFQ